MKYIDLGLPSGTLWSDCNAGATNCWDYGNYLNFNDAQQYGILPTKEQMVELVQYTTHRVCKIYSILGMQFTGKNSNSIFVPFVGFLNYNGDTLYDVDHAGYLWSCTHNGCRGRYHLSLYKNNYISSFDRATYNYRFSVRLIKNR